MGFWLYDPASIKYASLFPTGGVGNFLNTLSFIIVFGIVLIKSKFKNVIDDKTLYLYTGIMFVLITILGLLFGNNDPDEEGAIYDYDLTYE